MKDVLGRALARRGIDIAKVKLRPFSTRPFVPKSKAWVKGVVLVGEACGIDQTTGEGIAQAIEMGRIAASHLCEAFRTEQSALRRRTSARCTRRRSGRHLLQSAWLARRVYGRFGHPARRVPSSLGRTREPRRCAGTAARCCRCRRSSDSASASRIRLRARVSSVQFSYRSSSVTISGRIDGELESCRARYPCRPSESGGGGMLETPLCAEGVLVVEEAERARAARALEHGAQVAGHRRLDDEALLGARMDELEAHAVEERAIERVLLLEEAVRRRVAVALVAEDRVADRREVAADLMRAPCSGITRRTECPLATASRR